MRKRLAKKKKLYPTFYKSSYHYYSCSYWIYKKINGKWRIVNKNANGKLIQKLKNKKGVVWIESN